MKCPQSAEKAFRWQRPSRKSWARKTWIKSLQFPCSWLPRRPSPTKGFSGWLGALRWHRPSPWHSQKLPRNKVVVRWKGHIQSTLGLVEKLVTRKLSTKLKESTKLKVPIFGYKAKTVHCRWMTCNIRNRQMASLLSGSFHAFWNDLFLWMTSHTLDKQMASLLCGPFHAFSNDHFLWITSHTLDKQMAFLLCGFFHGSSNDSSL